MTATTPIFATGTTPIATPASPANSSLADFLLAASPLDAAQDFRAIVASLFGDASSTPNKIDKPAKDLASVTKSAGGISEDKRPNRMTEKGSAPPAAPAAPTDLAVPLLNLPQPIIPVVPKPEARPDTLGLQQISASLEGSAASRAQIQTPEIANLGGDAAATKSLPLSGNPKELATVEDDGSSVMSSAVENPAPLTQPATITGGVKPGKEAALRTGPEPRVALPTAGLPVRKDSEAAKSTNSCPRNQASNQAATGTTKQIPAQPGSMNPPTSPADVGAATAPVVPLSTVVIDSAAPVPTPEQTSVASAREILDSVIATRDAPKSEPLAPSAVAESQKPPGRIPGSGLARVKDRGNKDTRIAAFQSGTPALAQTRPVAGGATNFSLIDHKDVPGATLPSHSGAHTKAVPVKQPAGMPSSATALAETDGPDDALPTAGSSPVTTAKLVQSMSQSEFRVGMQSQEFGSIDIRTSVARHMFSAQISVEHSDMAKSLTADLPSLYGKLADQHVPVANIVIHGQSLATSSGLARDAQPQTWRPQSQGTARSVTGAALPLTMESFDSGSRLDIRI